MSPLKTALQSSLAVTDPAVVEVLWGAREALVIARRHLYAAPVDELCALVAIDRINSLLGSDTP
jgi:hypothetical protein